MDLSLEGRIAMITGGSRGLGRQIATALGREGCKVSICGRDERQVQETVAELAGAGTEARGSGADVTVEEEAAKFYDETVSQMGPPDILVNNVGGRRGSVRFEETSMEQFMAGLEVNLVSAVRLSAMVIPHMKEQGWGRIINIASIYGREHGGSIDYMTGESGTHCFLQTPGPANGAQRRAGELCGPGFNRLPRQHLGPVPTLRNSRHRG